MYRCNNCWRTFINNNEKIIFQVKKGVSKDWKILHRHILFRFAAVEVFGQKCTKATKWIMWGRQTYIWLWLEQVGVEWLLLQLCKRDQSIFAERSHRHDTWRIKETYKVEIFALRSYFYCSCIVFKVNMGPLYVCSKVLIWKILTFQVVYMLCNFRLRHCQILYISGCFSFFGWSVYVNYLTSVNTVYEFVTLPFYRIDGTIRYCVLELGCFSTIDVRDS